MPRHGMSKNSIPAVSSWPSRNHRSNVAAKTSTVTRSPNNWASNLRLPRAVPLALSEKFSPPGRVGAGYWHTNSVKRATAKTAIAEDARAAGKADSIEALRDYAKVYVRLAEKVGIGSAVRRSVPICMSIHLLIHPGSDSDLWKTIPTQGSTISTGLRPHDDLKQSKSYTQAFTPTGSPKPPSRS